MTPGNCLSRTARQWMNSLIRQQRWLAELGALEAAVYGRMGCNFQIEERVG